MAAPKDTVDFYWDPICPWCWITSRWMVDVCRQKHIGINWKFFSLKKINEGRMQIIPEHYRQIQAEGLMALRVAAAVRRDFGNEGVMKLYTALGALYHHDQEDLGEAGAIEGVLKVCGFPANLTAAFEDETFDKIIDADMAQATEKAGTDVGVPLIVLDGGKGPGFFGPVFSPAPTGQGALDLWDAIIVACRTPGFFELKRTRRTGPVFGERPTL